MRYFAVVRHSDRGDGVCETVNGLRWSSTSDYLRWPLDPPLSDEGIKNSELLANQVGRFSSAGPTRITKVVSSPYLRCLQTAARLCEVLGAPLVIDRSIGEVYGPSVMGESEPSTPIRTLTDVPPTLRHLLLGSETVGDSPNWPEGPLAARHRFRRAFLSYLRWAAEEQTNFIMVTHGNAIAASLAMMPSHAGMVLGGIETGGMFFARQPHEHDPISEEACAGGWQVETSGLMLHETGNPEQALLHRIKVQARSMGLPMKTILSLVRGTKEADDDCQPGKVLNLLMERDHQKQAQRRLEACGHKDAFKAERQLIEVQAPLAPSPSAPMELQQNPLFLRRIAFNRNSK